MSFRPTHEILDEIADFHRAIQAYYRDLRDRATNARNQLFLNYLIGYEEAIQGGIIEFQERGPDRIKRTWFQYTPGQRLADAVHKADINPDDPLDDLTGAVLDIDQALLDSYQQLADGSRSDDMRDMFTSLLNRRLRKRKDLVFEIQRLQGL